MVYLALTAAGLSEAMALANGQFPVWCTADAITESEFSVLAAKNVTRFVYSVSGPNPSMGIADAIETISLHHPGQRVWVEHAPAP
jgi:hypothetical protein